MIPASVLHVGFGALLELGFRGALLAIDAALEVVDGVRPQVDGFLQAAEGGVAVHVDQGVGPDRCVVVIFVHHRRDVDEAPVGAGVEVAFNEALVEYAAI